MNAKSGEYPTWIHASAYIPSDTVNRLSYIVYVSFDCSYIELGIIFNLFIVSSIRNSLARYASLLVDNQEISCTTRSIPPPCLVELFQSEVLNPLHSLVQIASRVSRISPCRFASVREMWPGDRRSENRPSWCGIQAKQKRSQPEISFSRHTLPFSSKSISS